MPRFVRYAVPWAFAGLLGALMVTAAPAAADGAGGGYRQVTGPCGLSFPRDHDAHPQYRTEWWYYTGNLTASDQRRFGFQLTFFRSRLRPPADDADRPRPASAWRTDQVYLAHAALSDLNGGRHLQAEKTVRAAMGLAGSERTGDRVTVHLLDWQAMITPEEHHIKASAERFGIDLVLSPVKPPVLQGDRGYSRKGSSPGRASCYYSYTRLAASGELRVDGKPVRVDGTAWMDHEFSSQPLEPGTVGWDWFSVQLSDRTELMLFLLRDGQGNYQPASAGTFVTADGRAVPLQRADIRAQVLDRWRSPDTGARYPARWRLAIERLQLTLEISSNLPDQEMRTSRSTGVTYWEGSIHAAGRRAERPVEGSGYMELTGYARRFEAPL